MIFAQTDPYPCRLDTISPAGSTVASEPGLDAIEKSYLQGLGNAQPAEACGDRLHSQDGKSLGEEQVYFDAGLLAWEDELVEACVQAQAQALYLTRKADWAQAQTCFDRVRALIRTSACGCKAATWCESFLLPADAYLAYRMADTDRARQLLVRAIDIDQILEHDYGCSTRHGHRILLVNNLVRLEARLGGAAEALRIAGRLLQYMHGKGDQGPTPGTWNPALRRYIRSQTRSELCYRTVAEIAQLFLGKTPVESMPLLQQLQGGIAGLPEDPWDSKAIEWLQVKQSFISGSEEEFFHWAGLYLETRFEHRPLLWWATVSDIVVWLNLRGLMDKKVQQLRERLLSDLMRCASPEFHLGQRCA